MTIDCFYSLAAHQILETHFFDRGHLFNMDSTWIWIHGTGAKRDHCETRCGEPLCRDAYGTTGMWFLTPKTNDILIVMEQPFFGAGFVAVLRKTECELFSKTSTICWSMATWCYIDRPGFKPKATRPPGLPGAVVCPQAECKGNNCKDVKCQTVWGSLGLNVRSFTYCWSNWIPKLEVCVQKTFLPIIFGWIEVFWELSSFLVLVYFGFPYFLVCPCWSWGVGSQVQPPSMYHFLRGSMSDALRQAKVRGPRLVAVRLQSSLCFKHFHWAYFSVNSGRVLM